MNLIENMENYRLIEIKPLHIGKRWFFTLTYECSDNKGNIYTINIPKVENPFKEYDLSVEETKIRDIWNWPSIIDQECWYNLGKDQLKIYPDDAAHHYYLKCIKEVPPKEMTIAEIEKQLGYEIKIVKDKNED